jgi:hypothetical protein
VILFSNDGGVIHIFRLMLYTCGFVESVHDFAVQGGAIMSFVGYFLLDKHFGSSIWERSSSTTPNTVQDWHCDGEERQTHRMRNNTSLLEFPTEFDTQQLGKPMLQDQQNIWLVNILLPYDCMQVQASW